MAILCRAFRRSVRGRG